MSMERWKYKELTTLCLDDLRLEIKLHLNEAAIVKAVGDSCS